MRFSNSIVFLLFWLFMMCHRLNSVFIYIDPFRDDNCTDNVSTEHGGIMLNTNLTCNSWHHSGGAEWDSVSNITCGHNWVSYIKHPGCDDCSCSPHVRTNYLNRCDEAVIESSTSLYEKLVEPYNPCSMYSDDEYGPPSDDDTSRIDDNDDEVVDIIDDVIIDDDNTTKNVEVTTEEMIFTIISVIFTIFLAFFCFCYYRGKQINVLRQQRAGDELTGFELMDVSLEQPQEFGNYDPLLINTERSDGI